MKKTHLIWLFSAITVLLGFILVNGLEAQQAPIYGKVPEPWLNNSAPTICPPQTLIQVWPGFTNAGTIYANSGTGTTCAVAVTPGGGGGVTSYNTRTGAVVPTVADINQLYGGGVFFVQNYYSRGATVDTWVLPCIADATAAGGICDTTALSGQTLTWAVNTDIVLGSFTTSVALRLPCSGTWIFNLSGGTLDMLDVNAQSSAYSDCSVEAASPGSFFLKNGSAAGGANYGLQTIPPNSSGGNAWYILKGFGIGQVANTTGFASGVVTLINAGEDQSIFDLYGLDGSATDTAIFQIAAASSGNKVCCNARIRLFTNSNYTGPTGVAVVGAPTNASPVALTFQGLNSEHPRAGQPNISCTDTNTTPLVTMHIAETLYLELNNTDTSTPAAVQVNGCAMFVVDNWVAKSEANSTTRPVFNISNAWNTNVHIGPGQMANGSGFWSSYSQAIVNANGQTVAGDAQGRVGSYSSLTSYFESVKATSVVGPLATNAVKGVMEGDGATITCVAGVCSSAGGASGGGVVGYSGLPTVSATVYVPLMGDTAGSTTLANVGWPAPSAAPVSNLQAYSSSVPGAGNTLVVTLYDGATPEAVTCTITAAANSCSDTTHSFTPAAGDLLTWQIAPTGTVVITPNIQIGANWATPSSGALNVTYYTSPFTGNTSIGMSITGTNRITGWAFTPAVNVTFSNIYLVSKTADAGGLYSAAIATPNGTLLCHPTTGIAVPTANSLMANPCSEGSVSLVAGTTYLLLTTGNALTGAVEGVNTNSMAGSFYSANLQVAGWTTASGVITGTSSVTLTPTAYTSGIPSFLLN